MHSSPVRHNIAPVYKVMSVACLCLSIDIIIGCIIKSMRWNENNAKMFIEMVDLIQIMTDIKLLNNN